jgi:hypothetical protein
MAGFGRFKLTDALPPEQQEQAKAETSGYEESGRSGLTGRAGKGKGKGKRKGRSGAAGKAAAGSLDAEQVREARESAQARNAEASTRDRMVDIGRGNQQAGRQRAK